MSGIGTFGGRRAIAWVVPLAVVAANLFWMAAFGSGIRVREADLGRRLDRAQRDEAEVAARLAMRERQWMAATENRQRTEELYDVRFATEKARFTNTVRELKALAERAGLDPGTISYPRESFEEYGLMRRSFVFSVNGSYGALRTFLHLVELSSSFFVVEQIDVGESGPGLGIRLRLSTLFVAEASEARPATAGSAGP